MRDEYGNKRIQNYFIERGWQRRTKSTEEESKPKSGRKGNEGDARAVKAPDKEPTPVN